MNKNFLIAAFAVLVSVGTYADKPRVTTNKRFARGVTMAFARATFTGDNISERGLCYSTQPTPTVDDNCSTERYSYDDNGVVYMIEGLEPATKYYMRPYAKTSDGEVGYGDVIKFYTLPKASITYSIRDGGDADAIERITAATKEAVDLWNNLTCIKGVNFNVGHNDGTPTADCSYGGYIRVGSNSSYQKTGTLLHEMLHGVGVGTHSVWWDSNMRSNGNRGYWLGPRTTEVVRFLENNDTEQLNGDATHMWPYGINGAHEDSGAKGLYIGCSLICEALGEDGLPPSGGFATPAYTFNQEDTVKYYLMSEDAEYGLYSSYLTEAPDGALSWQRQSNVTQNDSAAWYMTFLPNVSFYVLRNAATGHYMSFQSNAFTTNAIEAPLYTERMQLMQGRAEVIEGKDYRGYYIIKNSATTTPATLTAAADGKVSNTAYDLSTAATQQRWLILTAEDIADIEKSGIKGYEDSLDSLLSNAKKLLAIPHSEDAAGSDDTFTAEINRIEQADKSSIASIDQLTTELRTAIVNFLSGVTPTDTYNNPFDLTFFIENPSMDSAEGWSETPTLNYSCAEYYATTFSFTQTLTGMPKGRYQLKVQAFQRAGSAANSYTKFSEGNESITCKIYLNNTSKTIASIWSNAQDSKLGIGDESQQGGLFVPNDMESAAAYFNMGLYDNSVQNKLYRKGDLKVGIISTDQSGQYWTAFDNFRLYFYGTANVPSDGISDVVTDTNEAEQSIYDLQGRRLKATEKSDLRRGIYIIGGKKVVVK